MFNCAKDPRIVIPRFHNLITCYWYNSNGGIVGLFVKETFDFDRLNNLSVFMAHVFEWIFIDIISNAKTNKDAILGITYRPNAVPRVYFDLFSSTVHESMDIINNEGNMYVLMAYFDIDLLQFGIHKTTNGDINDIFSRGYMPVILQARWLLFSSTPASELKRITLYSNIKLLNKSNWLWRSLYLPCLNEACTKLI